MNGLGSIKVNGKDGNIVKANNSLVKRKYRKFYDSSYTKIQVRSVGSSSNNKLVIANLTENSITEFHVINKSTGEYYISELPTGVVSKQINTYGIGSSSANVASQRILPDGEYEIIIKGNFALGYYMDKISTKDVVGSTVFIDEVRLQSGLTNLQHMFLNCVGITDLKSNLWELGQIIDTSGMFRGCSNMTNIDISEWDMSKCRSISGMFEGCSSLRTIDIDNWDITGLTDSEALSNLFAGCSSLKQVNLSNWVLPKTEMFLTKTFSGCSSLKHLNLNGLDLTNIKGMFGTFEGCSSLKMLDLSNKNLVNLTDMTSTFDGCTSLEYLNVKDLNTSQCNYFTQTFRNCSSLTQLDLSSFTVNTSTTESDFTSMFENCSKLKTLDIINFEASNNTVKKTDMFKNCNLLTRVSFRFTDNQKLTYPYPMTTEIFNMYYNCSERAYLYSNPYIKKITGGIVENLMQSKMIYDANYTTLSYTEFKGSINKMTNLEEFSAILDGNLIHSLAFLFFECSSLKKIDMSKWNIPNINDMGYIFCNCNSLQSVNISKLDTSKVTNLCNSFSNCYALEQLDLSKNNFNSLRDITQAFLNCNSLKFLNITSINTNNIKMYDSFLQEVPQTCVILVSPDFKLTEQQCGWNGKFIVIN